MKSVFLITGFPGVGKTSLIKQAITSPEVKAGGFFTEEIRSGKIREGFRIVTLDGKTALLAHIGIRSLYKVSKYAVDIGVIDSLGVDTLKHAADQCDIVIIDEIGKMELLSERFNSTVLEIIESGKKVLGTIMLKPDPRADFIKQKPQVNLLVLTRQNRDTILVKIQNWISTGL
jgi:nucleoside-triphosphatase